jgi:hypothetical protein
LFTGDLVRECAFSSRTSAFDQVRRLVRLARVLADISELFRSFDKPPLAKLAFFVGC